MNESNIITGAILNILLAIFLAVFDVFFGLGLGDGAGGSGCRLCLILVELLNLVHLFGGQVGTFCIFRLGLAQLVEALGNLGNPDMVDTRQTGEGVLMVHADDIGFLAGFICHAWGNMLFAGLNAFDELHRVAESQGVEGCRQCKED